MEVGRVVVISLLLPLRPVDHQAQPFQVATRFAQIVPELDFHPGQSRVAGFAVGGHPPTILPLCGPHGGGQFLQGPALACFGTDMSTRLLQPDFHRLRSPLVFPGIHPQKKLHF